MINHWIGGAATPGTGGRRAPVYDPATGVVANEVDLATVDEVDAAVAARCRVPRVASDRARAAPEIMFRVRELLVARRDDIAAAHHRRARQGAVRRRRARWPAASRTSSSRAASRTC